MNIMVGTFEIDKNMTPCNLPPEAKKAFDEVYGGRKGCHFTPVLYCGKQIVAGTNYMIICKATPIVLHPELAEELLKVVIYAPLPNSDEPCREISREVLIGKRVAAAAGVELPNPYVEYKHIFEAEYAAHMMVYVPSKIHDTDLEHIYVIGGKVVELDYKGGLCLREAMGIEDISGVYEEYSVVKQFTVGGEIGGSRVVAKGNAEDKYNVILWHQPLQNPQCFSLYAPNGMSEAEIKAFIESLRVVN